MDKKFLLSLFLALVTVAGFQYFYGKRQQQKTGMISIGKTALKPGQAIKVPTVEQLHKPLNLKNRF